MLLIAAFICPVCRCEKESAQMSEGVVVVERELENQQQICETLQSELQELDQEAAQCQLTKTQVWAIYTCMCAT